MPSTVRCSSSSASEVGDRTLQDDPALGEHVAPARDLQRALDVLLHEQDADSGAVDLADDVEDLVDDDRREAERRLVHEEQPRLSHQCSADRQHLLLTAAQRPRHLSAALGQAGEEGVDPAQRLAVGRSRGVAVRAEVEVVADREAREDPASLRHDRDARAADDVGRLPGHVRPADPHRPVADREHAGDRLHQRRLARAVRAHDAHDFALGDVEVDRGQGQCLAVEDVDPANLKHRRPPLGRSARPAHRGRADRGRRG